MSRFSTTPLLRRTLACAAAALFAGCTSVYQVKVEALARPVAASGGAVSYRIKDAADGTRADSLRRQEIARHVRTALSAHGMYESPSAASADLVVEIEYGIGPERVQQTVYQELANGRPVREGELRGARPEGVARELMGYTELANTTVVREKHMSICARQNRQGDSDEPPVEVWRVYVSIDDEGDDLRGRLPVLASAAMDHVGGTTQGVASMEVRSDDERVKFIRKGM